MTKINFKNKNSFLLNFLIAFIVIASSMTLGFMSIEIQIPTINSSDIKIFKFILVIIHILLILYFFIEKKYKYQLSSFQVYIVLFFITYFISLRTFITPKSWKFIEIKEPIYFIDITITLLLILLIAKLF